MTGVPLGAQIAWLLCTSKGCPLERTRSVPVGGSGWAVTHGPLAAGGGGNVQPTTAYGEVTSTVGWPQTSTRGLGVVGVAWPP